jgi:ketopantoate reductase
VRNLLEGESAVLVSCSVSVEVLEELQSLMMFDLAAGQAVEQRILNLFVVQEASDLDCHSPARLPFSRQV